MRRFGSASSMVAVTALALGASWLLAFGRAAVSDDVTNASSGDVFQFKSALQPNSAAPPGPQPGPPSNNLPPPGNSADGRRPITIGLPVPHTGAAGELILEPNVHTLGDGSDKPPAEPPPPVHNPLPPPQFPAPRGAYDFQPLPSRQFAARTVAANGAISAGPTGRPTPAIPTSQLVSPSPAEPIVSELPAPGGGPAPEVIGGPPPGGPFVPGEINPDPLGGPGGPACSVCDQLTIWDDFHVMSQKLFGHCEPTAEEGIGHERLIYAPMFIETSQPLNRLSLRYDFNYDLNRPDRSDYFWARPLVAGGTGVPLLERRVNYQDLHAILEVGGAKFSTVTDIPIRYLDPEINDNTVGFSDMSVATKTVLLEGQRWEITQVFRTYIPTGAFLKGLGTGHVELEPGFLFRYKWDSENFIHSELKYWFPIAGDPGIAGQILKFSIGISHLYSETDKTATIETLELLTQYLPDGGYTDPNTGLAIPNNFVMIASINPGIRWVWDTGGDLGLVEFGIGAQVGISEQHNAAAGLSAELRFNF